MNLYYALAREADASRRGTENARAAWELRPLLERALAEEFPAASAAAGAARAAGKGKKAVVAAAAAEVLDLAEPEVQETLDRLARAGSWREAGDDLARLGFAGELIAQPQRRGLRLPCAPHACPSGWGTNWGLPNVCAVAEMLLRRAPAMPTRGNGWEFHPAEEVPAG